MLLELQGSIDKMDWYQTNRYKCQKIARNLGRGRNNTERKVAIQPGI
jgi:hypothetical protein